MNTQQVSTQVKDLLEQAKNLSEDERILLADLLYAESSLSQEEWEAAWLEECERRLGEYRTGRGGGDGFSRGFRPVKKQI